MVDRLGRLGSRATLDLVEDSEGKTVRFELSQRFYFEAAHTLQREFEAEGSRRIHGHTYHAEVAVCGQPGEVNGMVVDLAVLRAKIAEVREKLDHRMLDEVEGLGPGTLENLCGFIWSEVNSSLGNVTRVTVSRQASGDSCTLT